MKNKFILILFGMIFLIGIISASVGNHSLPTDLIDDCDGIMYCFAQWSSEVTSGAYWFMGLFAFCAILFMATMRFGTQRAFGFSTFVGMLGGVWLSILQLIPWWIGSTFIILGVIGLISLVISRGR